MKHCKEVLLILSILNAFSMYSGETFIHPNIHMSPDYNIHKAPIIFQNEPMMIDFSINLRNIFEVNERKQLITLEMDIHMLWKDARLEVDLKNESLDFVALNPVAAKYFWIPDFFIEEAKELPAPEVSRTEYDLKDQMIRDTIMNTQEDVEEIKEDVKNIERIIIENR